MKPIVDIPDFIPGELDYDNLENAILNSDSWVDIKEGVDRMSAILAGKTTFAHEIKTQQRAILILQIWEADGRIERF